jgi:isopentenyl diphosphate isomerase/L-lactate dehydrogenase-like FMN-dependent dehydrogenase
MPGQDEDNLMSNASSPNGGSKALRRSTSIADLRGLARRRLPKALFDFIDGGATDEITLRANESDFADWRLLPRQMVDVSNRSLGASNLGREAAMPLMISPTGLAGMYWPNGEIGAVRAAARAGIPLCLSTNSVASLEEVAQGALEADLWFQLYFLQDRDWMHALVDRAKAAHYRVLCVTVDLPVHGRRERDERNAFTIPLRPRLSNVADLARRPGWIIGAIRSPPRFGNFEAPGAMGIASITRRDRNLFDPTTTWDDVSRIREKWPGPFAVKGVLHPADAEKAVSIGADAIMVSNHGGRQLDRVPSALEALPEVVSAVNGRAEVILDGGIRRGADIYTALALGARACSIGRAFLWGLSAGGEHGVDRTLNILREEFDNTMALMGTPDVKSIDRSHVRHLGEHLSYPISA